MNLTLNCPCGNDAVNTRLTDFTVKFFYRDVYYDVKTEAVISSCPKCLRIWNNKDEIAYLMSKYFDWLSKMLDTLMSEVSLSIAVMRGRDYLVNGYYYKGIKTYPPFADDSLYGELSYLLESVLAATYWSSAKSIALYYTSISP